MPLSSYRLGLVRTLGSCATSKLMGCGLALGAFGLLLLIVPPTVDQCWIGIIIFDTIWIPIMRISYFLVGMGMDI